MLYLLLRRFADPCLSSIFSWPTRRPPLSPPVVLRAPSFHCVWDITRSGGKGKPRKVRTLTTNRDPPSAVRSGHFVLLSPNAAAIGIDYACKHSTRGVYIILEEHHRIGRRARNVEMVINPQVSILFSELGRLTFTRVWGVVIVTARSQQQVGHRKPTNCA